MTSPNNIHSAISAAMREAAAVGIGKTATANLGGANVKYRGIEQAMNTMVGILVRCGIVVTASYSDLQVQERAKDGGKFTRFATLRGAFTFAASDGSHVVAQTYGEAMDSGDKAIVMAQSVAFRTALFQTFVVPTRETAIDPEENGDDENDAPPPSPIPPEAQAAAGKGTAAYAAYWQGLTADQRRALFAHHANLKAVAAGNDKEAA